MGRSVARGSLVPLVHPRAPAESAASRSYQADQLSSSASQLSTSTPSSLSPSCAGSASGYVHSSETSSSKVLVRRAAHVDLAHPLLIIVHFPWSYYPGHSLSPFPPVALYGVQRLWGSPPWTLHFHSDLPGPRAPRRPPSQQQISERERGLAEAPAAWGCRKHGVTRWASRSC